MLGYMAKEMHGWRFFLNKPFMRPSHTRLRWKQKVKTQETKLAFPLRLGPAGCHNLSLSQISTLIQAYLSDAGSIP